MMLRNRQVPRRREETPRPCPGASRAASSAPRKTAGSRCRSDGVDAPVPAEALHACGCRRAGREGSAAPPRSQGGDENRLIPGPQNQALPFRMVPEGQEYSPPQRRGRSRAKCLPRQGRVPMAQGQDPVPLAGRQGRRAGPLSPPSGRSKTWRRRGRLPGPAAFRRPVPAEARAARSATASGTSRRTLASGKAPRPPRRRFSPAAARARAFRASSSRRRVSAARRMLPTAWGLMLSSTGRTWWRRRFRAGPSLPLLSSSTWGMAWSSA